MSSESRERYYIRSRGRVTGPYSTDQLRSLRKRGQFGRLHEVSTDRENWQPANSLEALFAATSARGAGSQQFGASETETFPIPTGTPASGPAPSNGESALPVKAVWHYAIGNEPNGPVTLLEIRNLIEAGELKSNDLVFREGLSDWQPVSETKELSSHQAETRQRQSEGYAKGELKPGSGKGIASLVLGLIGMFAWIIPVIGLPVTITGLVLGAKGLAHEGKGMATSGMILSIIGLILTIIYVALLVYLVVTRQI